MLKFSSDEMGTHSNAESQIWKKTRFSEPNASSETNLPFSNHQELCLRFSKGNCSYGERCRYAHDTGEVMRRRIAGKMNVCQYFVGGRPCPYGNNCRFPHDDGRNSSAICIDTCRSYGDDGDRSKKFLNRSSNVPQSHQNVVRWKTRLCGKWEKMGNCSNGSHCNYAHGNAELQRGYNLDTTSKNAESQHFKRFKCTDIRKISEVYADWIDNVPLIPVSSGKIGN